MKQKHEKKVTTLSAQDLTKLFKEIAVELGVRMPQTIEEVKLFESAFANEIQAAKLCAPDLKNILALAQKVNSSGTPIVMPIEDSHAGYNYLIAARNSESINSETIKKLDAAIQKKRQKLADG